jgi:opacity protein-like surface antigen
MRIAIIAALACAVVLGASASSASAADLANVSTNVCNGTAEWQVNLVGAYADITVTSSDCKVANVWVEGNGNPHVNVTDGGYTGGYRTSLLGINVTGTNSFVGIAHGYVGGGPVAVVSPNTLQATMQGSTPSTASPSVSTEVHLPNGSCGTNCYKTNVIWSTTYDRTP